MEVPFDHEQINQIETIKKAIKNDFEKMGFDVKPQKVTDLMALEYALTFTAEVISIDYMEEKKEIIAIDESSMVVNEILNRNRPVL